MKGVSKRNRGSACRLRSDSGWLHPALYCGVFSVFRTATQSGALGGPVYRGVYRVQSAKKNLSSLTKHEHELPARFGAQATDVSAALAPLIMRLASLFWARVIYKSGSCFFGLDVDSDMCF